MFDISIEPEFSEDIGKRIFPKNKTRVIVKSQKETAYALPEMQYSLVPSWSKESTVKWTSYNARLERVNPNNHKAEKIFEVPTWKESFSKFHCVVPMTNFFESCRERGLAKGHEVSFQENEGNEIMLGAGIYSIWKGKVKEEEQIIYSFAVITTDPTEFIESVGHDRTPVFLKPEDCKIWLNNHFDKPEHAYQFLKETKYNPDLNYKIIRQLKGA